MNKRYNIIINLIILVTLIFIFKERVLLIIYTDTITPMFWCWSFMLFLAIATKVYFWLCERQERKKMSKYEFIGTEQEIIDFLKDNYDLDDELRIYDFEPKMYGGTYREVGVVISLDLYGREISFYDETENADNLIDTIMNDLIDEGLVVKYDE